VQRRGVTKLNLHLGDCLSVLKTIENNSIHAVITDPPYGLKFMNKAWDYDVPKVEFWKEVLRVLKPGGHLLSFGGTRTYHRMVVNIEDAGFEIRDQIQWLYGSGFPKSLNLKNEWEGWGTALKPANEPIVMARKPIEKGLTVAENVIKWGTGAINIDASRIGTEKGRWPANLLLDEQAAEMLDEQSGYLAPAGNKKQGMGGKTEKSIFGIGGPSTVYHDGGGGASRFFYVAKANKSERGKNNNHPTVKPIKLMKYLITLVTPQNGIVLDPFMGSGSTGVAAKELGFDFVGIELNEEYLEIAKRRING
jgi:DNA modification methylase